MTIRRTRIACWTPKATNTHTHTHTHSQYVILIAFSLQKCLHERVCLLRYAYIASLVILHPTPYFLDFKLSPCSVCCMFSSG